MPLPQQLDSPLTLALASRFPVVFADFRSIDRFLYRIRDIHDLPELIEPDLLKRLDECHLYMICKRPRLSVVPDSISWGEEYVYLKVHCSIRGVTHEAEVEIQRNDGKRAASFVASPFPHRELLGLKDDGSTLSQMLFANMAHLIETLPPFARQLEVLYIGKGLAKNTQDRLKSHSTLQKVLAQINSDDPETEVFALVYKFDYRRTVGGLVKHDADKVRVLNLRHTIPPYRPSLDDQISLVEACAISYFKTDQYNTHYINFPAATTDASRRASSAQTEFLLVQIDNENIGGLEIYSREVAPASAHYIEHSIAP